MRKVVVIALLLMLASSLVGASSDWKMRPGTIGYALSMPDGVRVSLDRVVVGKIKAEQTPNYFVVYESFSFKDRLIILSEPSTELRLKQDVDIEGTLTTLRNGYRALINVSVYGYVDKNGNLLQQSPHYKILPEQIPWPWKINLIVDSNITDAMTFTSQVTSDEPNPFPAEGPTFYPRIRNAASFITNQTDEVRAQSYHDDIQDLVGLAPGSLVELQCKRITDVGNETINGTSYKYVDIAEDSSAQYWIRCYYSAQNEIAIGDRANIVTGQIRYTNAGTTEVICIDDGPGYDYHTLIGTLVIANTNTIAFARTLANGTSITLTGKVVTANQTDFPGTLYVQEASDSGYFSGIRVQYAGANLNRGDLVDISGVINTTADGERVVNAGSTGITFIQQGNATKALGLSNRSLGGGDFNIYTPGVNYPADSGNGFYNKGLLVKSWGRVTAVDAANKYFYIDDGTKFEDGSGNIGVKVSWDWTISGKPLILPPSVGWYVSVIGISSSEYDGDNLIRVLRIRNQSDLLAITVNPEVAITSPTGSDWRIASGATSIIIEGTATEEEIGITSVDVKIDSGQWQTANYNATTHVWTFNWQNPQSARFTVRASDSIGHSAEIYRDVTISSVGVIYVKPSGNDNNDGYTWGAAKKTVQGAIDAANGTTKTEVWVAVDTVNTYQECINLKSGVSLYGGFDGTEYLREQRDWVKNTTILDGNGVDGVVNAFDISSSTVIDGFKIINGYPITNWNGGGIYCYNSSLTISHNIISNNIADIGGAIYCSGGSPKITDNTITGNTAYNSGAGIGCENSSSPIISHNAILNNGGSSPTPDYGGAISCANSSPIIIDNTIDGNVAYNGSGVYCYESSAELTRNLISNNTCGGSIHIASCNSVNIMNNTITRNIANGIYCYGSTVKISNNVISQNQHSGVYYYDYATTGNLSVINNTIINNGQKGIHLNCGTSTSIVKNNIVASNTNGIYSDGTLDPTVGNCCVIGNTEWNYYGFTPSNLTGINGNISVDPKLVGFHLQGTSPCCNVGDNAVVLAGDIDIDGQPRKQPTGDPNPVVDIGADEWDALDSGVPAPTIIDELEFFSSLINYCN